MKKVFFTMMVVGLTAICAQAQIFIGGTLGMDYSASSAKNGATTTKGPSNTYFEISPMVGYQLSKKLALGAKVYFSTDNTNDRQEPATTETITMWGFEPFVRYTVFNLAKGKLLLLLEGSIEIAGGSASMSQGAVSQEGGSVSAFVLNAQPVLQYKASKKWTIEAVTNFAQLRFGAITEPIPGQADSEISSTIFGFGANYSVQGAFGTAPFQIGAIYTF